MFVYRYFVLYDYKIGDVYLLLYVMKNVSVFFDICNSLLFEGFVFGFEYGYNVFVFEMFVFWEV